MFLSAQYACADLRFRCADAELSPPSHNGFVTRLGTGHACEGREGRVGGGPAAAVNSVVAKTAVAYYLTLHVRAASRHPDAEGSRRGYPRASRFRDLRPTP